MNSRFVIAFGIALIVSALVVWGCVSVGMSVAADLTEGRLSIFIMGFLMALLLGLVAWVVSYALLDDDFLSSSTEQKALVAAVIAFICTFAPPLYTVLFEGGTRVTSYLVIAPRLEEFTRANFSRIQDCGAAESDANSALIVKDEVEACLESSTFKAEEKVILLALVEQLKLLGHVIGTESSSGLMLISSGNGGTMMVPYDVDSAVYGIALADLAGYRGRLTELAKSWH